MQKTETFYLKNMVSNSCIKLIELYFNTKKDVSIKRIVLGEVILSYDGSIIVRGEIIKSFHDLGFEVINDPHVEIVEKIKIAAIELIFKSFNTNSLIRNSDYISEKLQLPYDKISRIFSQVTGIKLEKYIILLKLEKAKEMLLTKEFNISEIAFMMDYSSVQYFSNQFKKHVGVTISQYKTNPAAFRKSLEELL